MLVLPQLFMLFFIAAVGALLRKWQVLTDPVIKGVSDIVTLATNPAHRVFCCFKCRKNRYAKNLVVHAYYDGTRFYCSPEKGCAV